MITTLSVVILALAVWAVRREVQLRDLRADRDSWRAEHNRAEQMLSRSRDDNWTLWREKQELRAELAKFRGPRLRAPNGRFVSSKRQA